MALPEPEPFLVGFIEVHHGFHAAEERGINVLAQVGGENGKTFKR
jgi:hypothetical protein